MRFSRFIAAIVAGMFICCGVTASLIAQQPQRSAAAPKRGAASTTPVAVVDISYIFKNHNRFKGTMENMKKQVQAFEEQLRARHKDITKRREQLSEFKPGSAEFKKIEEEISRVAAQLQVDTQLKRKEFLEAEAKVYFQVYSEVAAAIKDFADRNGIGLVLRFNGEDMDPQDRASVLQGVNRAVVYHRNLNITYQILDRLNRTAGGGPNPTAQRRPPPTAPRKR